MFDSQHMARLLSEGYSVLIATDVTTEDIDGFIDRTYWSIWLYPPSEGENVLAMELNTISYGVHPTTGLKYHSEASMVVFITKMDEDATEPDGFSDAFDMLAGQGTTRRERPRTDGRRVIIIPVTRP